MFFFLQIEKYHAFQRVVFAKFALVDGSRNRMYLLHITLTSVGDIQMSTVNSEWRIKGEMVRLRASDYTARSMS